MTYLRNSLKLTKLHLTQMNEIVHYVHQLKDAFGLTIAHYNRKDANETLKLPEHLLRSFDFSPLFSPINTFARDWYYDPKDPKSFALLRIYVDLEDLFTAIRHTDSIEYQRLFIPFFTNHEPGIIDYVIEQMYGFLRVVVRNVHAIYSYAVSFFYSIDSEADDQLVVKELHLDVPYIRDKRFSTSSGRAFSWFLISAMGIYFNDKIQFTY